MAYRSIASLEGAISIPPVAAAWQASTAYAIPGQLITATVNGIPGLYEVPSGGVASASTFVAGNFTFLADIAPALRNVVTKTGNYTAAPSDYVLGNAAGAAFVVTSPTTTLNARVTVKKIDTTANAVTFTPVTGTVDGAASFALTSQYDAADFTSDGANWFVS